MLAAYRDAIYAPILKGKFGEYRALSTVNRPNRILPLIDLPPSGGFDHEAGRILGPTEHIRSFGARIARYCGKRPIFVDAVLIDDELHRQNLSNHPLTELLERARLEGAVACPVTAIGRTAEYQRAVGRFLGRQPHLAVCLRVMARQLESDSIRDSIRALLNELKCEASRAVLLVDLGARHASKPNELADVLIDRLNELPFLHDWVNLVVALTSLPEKIFLRNGETRAYERTDWETYRLLIESKENLLRTPIFGDYAVDAAPHQKKSRAIPVAHFRYTGDNHYVVVKGQSVKLAGYDAIFPVADRLVEHREFKGKHFSSGDNFIDQLVHRQIGSGTASTWRWATTDHHLTFVVKRIASLLGIEDTDVAVPGASAFQMSLL